VVRYRSHIDKDKNKTKFLMDIKYDPGCCKKGKAIQLQAWTGPEGSRRLRLPDFKTVST